MNTELHLFRIIDGQRRAVKLVLDESRLILSETVSEQVALSPAEVVNVRDAALAQRGVEFHRSASGQVVIDKVPEREQEVLSFFSTAKPCWFPGCEDLRQLYQAELDSLGENCPACEQGNLIRKYMAKVRDILPNATPGN